MSDLNLDSLIEEAFISANLAGGVKPEWLAQHADPRQVAVLGKFYRPHSGPKAFWTTAEIQFLVDNHAWLPIWEIASRLGRTVDAVDVKRTRDLHIKGVSSTKPGDEWMTVRQVAIAIGVGCSKSVMRWINLGLLPGRPLPLNRKIIAVHLADLTKFAVNPENWVYFRPERVTLPKLRRLLAIRRARWPDDWWTPGQVAAYHGVTVSGINNQMRKGIVPAKRWGNWWIKRSDAVNLRFLSAGVSRIGFSVAGDHFLLLCQGIGLAHSDVDGLCGWKADAAKRGAGRWGSLRKNGLLPALAQQSPYGVQCDPERGIVFADWRPYRHKFPRLDRAVQRFQQGQASRLELRWIAGVLHSWLTWHARTPAQQALAKRTEFLPNPTRTTVETLYAQLKVWGIDPL